MRIATFWITFILFSMSTSAHLFFLSTITLWVLIFMLIMYILDMHIVVEDDNDLTK